MFTHRGKNGSIYIACIFWLLCCLCIQLHAARPFPEFRTQSFHVNGEIHNIFCDDLNGDSETDLIVLHNQSLWPDTRTNRYISFFYGHDGQFSNTPNQTLNADLDDIVIDFQDLDGDGAKEYVSIKNDGVYAKHVSDMQYSESENILTVSSVFLSPDSNRLIRWPLIRDVDGDTIPELLIPGADAFEIYKSVDDEYHLFRRLNLSPGYSISENGPVFSFRLPELVLRDFNGDGFSDLIFIDEDRLYVFLHRTSRPFLEKINPDFKIRLGAQNDQLSTLEQLAPAEYRLVVEDLNRDGYADCLLSKASRGSYTNTISQIQVYMNYGRIENIPDQILPVESFDCEYIVSDFNNDSLMDIAVLQFPIGLIRAAKFAITRKIKYTFNLHTMQPDHQYASKPSRRMTFSRRMKIQNLLKTDLVQYGDFSGNGILDLMVITDPDTYSIFPGNPNTFFDNKAAFKIHIPVTTHMRVHDINKDNRADILLWYPGISNKTGHFILMRSERLGGQ